MLVSRPAFAGPLLDALAQNKISRSDLSAFHVRQIRSFNDDALSKRLAEVWGELRDTSDDKKALIAKLKTQLTPAVLAGAVAVLGLTRQTAALRTPRLTAPRESNEQAQRTGRGIAA